MRSAEYELTNRLIVVYSLEARCDDLRRFVRNKVTDNGGSLLLSLSYSTVGGQLRAGSDWQYSRISLRK